MNMLSSRYYEPFILSHRPNEMRQQAIFGPWALNLAMYFRGKSHCKSIHVILTDHLNPKMKYFYPDGSGLFPDYIAPIHRA